MRNPDPDSGSELEGRGDPNQGWLAEQLDEAGERLGEACVRVEVGPVTDSPTASFVTGHAYLPRGSAWPTVDGRPGSFVAQVNFAEVPHLAGFPTRGLLQWFVGGDDLFGLTFDAATRGEAGFVARWWPDPDPGLAQQPPTAPAPGPGPFEGPLMDVLPASSLRFAPARSLPGWEELSSDERAHPVWTALALADQGTADEGPGWGWSPRLAAYVGYWGSRRSDPRFIGSQIGGAPDFTQGDPRGTGRHFPADHPAGRLLLALDSAQVGGWGDAGSAQLFGDPQQLARGELSSLRWDWACG